MSESEEARRLKSSSTSSNKRERRPSNSSLPSVKSRAPNSRNRPPMSPKVDLTAQKSAKGKGQSSESMTETLNKIIPPPPPGHAPELQRPVTKTSSNRPRPPSWLLEGNKENGDDVDFKDKQKAKYMVEGIRTVLRETDTMKPLCRYLRDHIGDIFTDGKVAPEANDVRHIVVMAWIEELLRFLVIKVMSNDILSPCKLGSTPPIDIAWMGLTQFPSSYGKICRKLGVKSGIIENDVYSYDEDDENDDIAHKKGRFSYAVRAYQHFFDQAPPDLFWPEPKEKVDFESENFMDMINRNVASINVSDMVNGNVGYINVAELLELVQRNVESINVADWVPESIMNDIKEYFPEAIMNDIKEYDPQNLYEKTTKIFHNGSTANPKIETNVADKSNTNTQGFYEKTTRMFQNSCKVETEVEESKPQVLYEKTTQMFQSGCQAEPRVDKSNRYEV